jgi:murein endopeptidase
VRAAHRHRRDALHCCPACEASLGARRRRRGVRPPWAWALLLALVAALVPLAALEGGDDRAVAIAAETPAPRPPVPEKSPEPAPKPAPPKAPVVRYRDSVALGTPNGGSLVDGVRLPVSGPGFYTYDPATQRPPGGADREWGTATLVRQVIALGKWWAATHPKQPRLGIGDLSRPHGGPFTGPGVGHASHQNGLDVDIRLVRRDGAEAAADPSTYDPVLNQQIVDHLVASGAQLVLVGPHTGLHGPSGVVMPWPAHDDHIHLRIPDPDGTGN